MSTPTGASTMMEHRSHRRIPFDCPVSLRGKELGEVQGGIYNISLRGLLVTAPTLLPKGASVTLQCLWPPSRSCVAHGQIIRVQSKRFGISLDDHNEAFADLVHVLEVSEPEEAHALGEQLLMFTITIA